MRVSLIHLQVLLQTLLEFRLHPYHEAYERL
uniref:Uncharacterized protein n=1 Tax=Anguilla anguilla TaxID=7936 RepID=A0A0E9QVT3_ANGAN